jgi:short-subunit dehydrogenase
MGPTAEVPLSTVQQCFGANVFGLLDVCQQAVPLMAAQGHGKIINIGSLTGFSPVPLRWAWWAQRTPACSHRS